MNSKLIFSHFTSFLRVTSLYLLKFIFLEVYTYLTGFVDTWNEYQLYVEHFKREPTVNSTTNCVLSSNTSDSIRMKTNSYHFFLSFGIHFRRNQSWYIYLTEVLPQHISVELGSAVQYHMHFRNLLEYCTLYNVHMFLRTN